MVKKISIILILFLLFAVPTFANNAFTSKEYTKTTSYSSNAPETSDAAATTSLLDSMPEADLGLTNILNIFLIVIGILLILLGIAILIRLKH